MAISNPLADEIYEAEISTRNAYWKAHRDYKYALRTGDPQQIEAAQKALEEASIARDEARKASDEANETSAKETKEKIDNVAKAVSPDINNTQVNKRITEDAQAMVSGKSTGNTYEAAADKMQRGGDLLTQGSANTAAQAQNAYQISNRNEYSEAGKTASVQNDAQNRQQINNVGFAAGTSAARLRANNAPDIATQRQRQDEQRQIGNQLEQKKEEQRRAANNAYGDAEQLRREGTDYDRLVNEGYIISGGQIVGKRDKTQNETETQTQTQTEPETQTETPKPEAAPDKASWQIAYNYLTYGADPTSSWNTDANKAAQGKQALQTLGYGNLQPITPEESQGNFNNAGAMQNILKQARPSFDKAYWNAMNGVRMVNGKQINLGENGLDRQTLDNVTGSQGTTSDERLKRMYAALDSGDDFTDEDFIWLARQQGGKYNHNGEVYDMLNTNDLDRADTSVLDGYSNFIRNYLYSYKPEAQVVDQNIDTNKMHIGPMAQDIEQVNPSCIIEDPSGYKTVDTARLALMNAGAIGDIARELKELKEMLNGLR